MWGEGRTWKLRLTRFGVFTCWVRSLCTRQQRARRAMRCCSSLRTGVRCVVRLCLARRSRNCWAHPAAVSRLNLTENQCGHHQTGSRQPCPSQAFAQQPPCCQRGKYRLQPEDDGAAHGVHTLLPPGLQSDHHHAGQQPQVDQCRPCRCIQGCKLLHPCHAIATAQQKERGSQAHHGCLGGCHARGPQRGRQIAACAFLQCQDVDGIEDGACQGERI